MCGIGIDSEIKNITVNVKLYAIHVYKFRFQVLFRMIAFPCVERVYLLVNPGFLKCITQ